MRDLDTERFAAILDGARRGDRDAAEALFVRFHPQLVRYVRAREPRHADDLVADVWAAVAEHLGRFDGDERGFRAWLFTIARNQVTGHRRRGLRRRTDLVDHLELTDLAACDTPDEDAVRRARAAEASALIDRHLSPTQAEVVRLRVLAELSAAEVAAILGRDESWVRVTQHRALDRLARRLPENFR